MKRHDNRAWLFVLPVLIIVGFSAILPLMTVVNYSVQDLIGPERRIFVGLQWYRAALSNVEFQGAFGRQILFTLCVLCIEIPLGVFCALQLPRLGSASAVVLVLLALPLLIPWNVVGTIWQIFARTDIGPLGVLLRSLGLEYNYALRPLDAWGTVLLMDVWHWTPLAALMAYAGLRAIPDPYYQAARIDGASRFAVFRFVELPRLRSILVLTVLLRFMDSFMIYTEPFVLTGGGPGNATTFLSQFTARVAVGQFDLGPAAAFSLIYFLWILLFCYVFFVWITKEDPASGARDSKVD